MIDVRENVLVAPFTKASSQGWIGGPDPGQIPRHGRLLRFDVPRDVFPDELRSQSAEHVQGCFLYGGPLKNHFGHLMIDSIVRLWAFDPARHEGVVFSSLDVRKPSSWMLDTFELFGVSPRHLQILTKPAVISTLEFAQPGSLIGQGPRAEYLDFLLTLPIRTVGDTPPRFFWDACIFPAGARSAASPTFGSC